MTLIHANVSGSSGSDRRACRLTLAALALAACFVTVCRPAAAQIDTPAASEARAALRAFEQTYGARPEWLRWSPLLNVPDLRYELHAGDRAEADALVAAILQLLSGKVPQFSQPEFARLATALDVRAQELRPVAVADWSSGCRQQAEQFVPISNEALDQARLELERRMDQFEEYYPPVRTASDGWSEFLYWPETRNLATPARPAPPPDLQALDRLETRWAAAPTAWDDALLFETSLAARTYIRLMRGVLKGETREQHAAAWNELADLLATGTSDEAHRNKIAAAVHQRESLGEASRLTSSIRRGLSHPNLVVQVNRKWFESRFAQQIDEPFEVDGVFAGTRSVGSGRTVGQMWGEVLPSRAVGQLRLRIRGDSTSRASGGEDRVSVVSRATTRVSATKPFVLDASGLLPQRASAGARTSIDYESINARGLARRRNAAVSETYARRPQAERESAAYARRSMLDQINGQAAELTADFNAAYRKEFRDPRIHSLRPGPLVRVRTGGDALNWECLLEGPATFAAAVPPPEYSGAGEVVVSLAPSALKEQGAMALAGRTMTSEELQKTLGAAEGEVVQSGGDEFRVTFDDDPCDVRFTEGVIHVRLFVTDFASEDVTYPSMSVDVAYRPQLRDGQMLLVREGRVRVTPRASRDGEKPRLSGRQQTLRVAVERKLAKVLSDELPWPAMTGPLAEDEQAPLRLVEARVDAPWLQLAFTPEKSQ